MRSRRGQIGLTVSLVANVVLGLSWWLSTRPTTVLRVERPPAPAPITNVLRPLRTNLVVQPRLLSWRDIESGDYPTYIRNLRALGCPEATIRDIIVADVNELFAQRRATEVISPGHQWWRSEPDPEVLERSMDQRDALEMERRALLTRLLGPNWDTAESSLEVPGSAVTLDGPLLGELSGELKHRVREIELRNRERVRALQQAAREAGREVDPAELVRIRQETREDLARVLTPAQMEEYLLRYANNAQEWRERLKGFEATADEFRGIFQATDTLETELATLAGTQDAAGQRRRTELETKREQALLEALGPERYATYLLHQDPQFQQVRETAEQLDAPAETVLPFYQIQRESERERRRILADAALTPEQQAEQLGTVDRQRLEVLRRLLGDERFRRWQSSGAR